MLTATALSLLFFLTPAAATADDVSGQWSGSYRLTWPTGETDSASLYLALKQSGSDVSGTADPDEESQRPITKGRFEGGKLSFDLKSDGPSFTASLTLVDGRRLTGEATGKRTRESSP